ncbi:hypothetical protein FB451DRAFT_1170179 [Mycena latifolia]|nr:hypothetical protein FB451DRAFT_1170179 [Mycena latifolia]
MWAGTLDSDPCKALENSLTLAYMGGFYLVLMGDLNARTASSKASPRDPDRISKDEKESTDSRWLARMCKDYNIVFINLKEDLGAHHSKRREIQVDFLQDTELDRLLIATPESAKDEKKKKCLALFSPVRVESRSQCMAPVKMQISTRSEYAIRAAKFYSFKNDARGWRCPNGDLLKIVSKLIKERTAPVHFLHIKKMTVASRHLTGSKELANTPPVYGNLPRFSETALPPIDVEKATVDVPDDRASDSDSKTARKPYPEKHRGRDKLGAIRDANRDKLFNAPSSGVFWKETLGSLIPENTEDPTPERFLSAAWFEDDAAWVKDHLLEHSLDSSSGDDGWST